MERLTYSVKMSLDVKEKVKDFCERYGIKQSYFVETALSEKLAREETVQDVLELKRLKDLEPQAVSFEEYLKDRNV